MKKIKIEAQMDEDKIGFLIQKTKNTNKMEIVGMLDFIKKEILDGMGDKIKIENRG